MAVGLTNCLLLVSVVSGSLEAIAEKDGKVGS